MYKNCCENCFADEYIKEYIRNMNVIGSCDFCGKKNTYIISYYDIGHYLLDCVNKKYSDIDAGDGAIYDGENKEYEDGHGKEPSIYSIRDILGYGNCFSDEAEDGNLLDEIIDTINPSYREVQKGAEEIDIDDPHLVIKNDLYWAEDAHYYNSWLYFKMISLHYNRFFDIDINNRRQDFLEDITVYLKCYETSIRKNTAFYRGRICNDHFKNIGSVHETYKNLGPPPSSKTKPERMSPTGISYLYVAADRDTALSELSAEKGSSIIVAKMRNTRKLKILDFTKRVYIGSDSIFNPKYQHDKCWIDDFLKGFTEEISKPVKTSDKEYEYIATQVIAEYIRYLGYDGICYSSSKSAGKNYVFFCGPHDNPDVLDEVPSLIDFSEWFTILSYAEIQVKAKIIKKADECIDGMIVPLHKVIGVNYRCKIVNQIKSSE